MPIPISSPRRCFAAATFALLALVAIGLTLAGCGNRNAVSPVVASARLDHRTVALAPAAVAQARQSLEAPIHLVGEIGPGALYSIDVPQQWNGDLVVYLHGYTVPALPVALPAFAPVRDSLLARGFAVVASSYSENGYAVKEGMSQSHQLSGLFASQVAQPNRTFLFGRSLGGIIGLLLAEKYSNEYAGGLLVSGVVGGTDDQIQYLGDIRVLFDAIYPGVLAGTLENPPVITNVNTQVVVPVVTAVTANPQGLGILQLLARRPLPGTNGQELVAALVNALSFAMSGGGDLYDRTHHHSFFDNGEWHYASAALPPALVADINARVARYTRTPDAAAYIANYGEASGRLGLPLLTLHTTLDPLVPYWHEALLAQAEAGPYLLQRSVVRFGHDNCTAAEMMAGFDALVGWVNTGQKPAL